MDAHGSFRDRIAGTLRAAYGDGLLSEATFVQRLDALWAGHVVDPARLVGDLTLRPAPSVPSWRERWPWRKALALLAGARPGPTALLTLDWSGSCEELIVGRHPACDVVFADLEVSRRHARLRFRDGCWVLQDLESLNGTFVNGTSVVRCQLRSGDELRLGPVRLFVD